jgi:hypothetical protein
MATPVTGRKDTAMTRSTKDAWLTGPGDLKQEEVQDVPAPGQSVLVRGLPAKYSAEIQGQLKLVTEGREQVAKIDVPSMELLQFVHGVVDPTFSRAEAEQIQAKFGPAFRKVIAKIDELSGIDKEAIEQTEQRFPAGGTSQGGTALGDGTPAGNGGSAVPARVG